MKEQNLLLIILDGLGDRPIPELQYKTPLEAAKTPNMDELVKKGITGLLHTIKRGITPGSDTAHLALFGYNPYDVYTGRGPFEAAGINLPVKAGDIAFRTNLATIKNGVIVNRRAGRISERTEEIELALQNIIIEDVEILFKIGIDHRAALILRGPGLSNEIIGNDPKTDNKKPEHIIPKTIAAEKTAHVLKKFIIQSTEILESLDINRDRIEDNKLPANFLLIRGAGKAPNIENFQTKFGISAECVAGGGLYKGVASICGMKINDHHNGTGGIPTDLHSKVKATIESLDRSQFVFMHIKGTDNFGHDGKAIEKMKFIEEIDQAIEPLLNYLSKTIICITGDHSTPCTMHEHSSDPIPLLISGDGIRRDEIDVFGEHASMRGGLGHLLGQEVIPVMLGLTGRVHKFGA